jgi:tol-pal system protein YbgF
MARLLAFDREMGSVSILRQRLGLAVVSCLFAGCAHAPESGPSPPGGDDAEAGLRRDNASLRRRVQMLEDRVLKLEHRVDGPGPVAATESSTRVAGTKKLPDGRELPVVRLEPEQRDPALGRRGSRSLPTEAEGGTVALEALEHEELSDERLWSDPSGFAVEDERDASGKAYRLVGQELVRMTEPDRAKPPDRQPAGASGKSLQRRYAAAIELYRAAAYAEAEQAFEGIAADFPRSDYADNAWYWMGEAAYDQEHFSDALAAFTTVIERYAGGNKAPDALLKIGLCYDKLGDRDNARDVLSQLVSAYPGASASGIARARLAELGG